MLVPLVMGLLAIDEKFVLIYAEKFSTDAAVFKAVAAIVEAVEGDCPIELKLSSIDEYE